MSHFSHFPNRQSRPSLFSLGEALLSPCCGWRFVFPTLFPSLGSLFEGWLATYKVSPIGFVPAYRRRVIHTLPIGKALRL